MLLRSELASGSVLRKNTLNEYTDLMNFVLYSIIEKCGVSWKSHGVVGYRNIINVYWIISFAFKYVFV